MEFFAYIMVFISAFTHAYWNFVLKQAGGTQVFIGLSKIAEIVLFIIPFIYLVKRDEIVILNYWLFYVIGAFLVLFNYLFLGWAYKHGDLSMVYPTSRAGALLFLPILAFFFIGEKIDLVGIVSILLIFVGLFTIQMLNFSRKEIAIVFSKFKKPATCLALTVALITAIYTLWDKHSISFLSPFIYFYSYTAIVGVSYAAFIWLKYPWEEIKQEWTAHKSSIIKVGL